MEDDSELPNDPEALQAVIEEIEAKVFSLQGSIAQEEAKMEKYKVMSSNILASNSISTTRRIEVMK